MTVKELIAELRKWPDTDNVVLTREVEIGAVTPLSIVRVSGAGGAAIDGTGGCVCLNYRDDDDDDD